MLMMLPSSILNHKIQNITMHCTFKTFHVGAGDCITLLLQNDNKEIHILVDCGKFTTEVKYYICQKFGERIDYLIVTHFDNDHINGIIAMLRAMPDLTINHILYNCYQRTSEHLEQWDDKMIENVKRLYGRLPVVVDMLENKINADSSVTLADLILNNVSWKNAWRREYITSETEPIELGENMGRLRFLSPNQEALDKLDKEYRKLFWQKLYKKKEADYKKEETIYEALMRIMLENENVVEKHSVSATELDEAALLKYAEESLDPLTDSNEASIAFVWEHDSHKILFCGDASPKVVSDKVKDVYADLPKPIVFDAIKVSHHGSAHSTSKEQLSVVDSEHYFVTGGAKVRPSFQALSRIVTAQLPQGVTNREIRFNRNNEVLKTLKKTPEAENKES